MRISDWSSDVCSSYLIARLWVRRGPNPRRAGRPAGRTLPTACLIRAAFSVFTVPADPSALPTTDDPGDPYTWRFEAQAWPGPWHAPWRRWLTPTRPGPRSDEGRVGKEGVKPGIVRWRRYH